jgi:hypothetical protein
VPPQNPVGGAIVDVSVLGVKLAYPVPPQNPVDRTIEPPRDSRRLHESSLRDWAAPIAIEEARPKLGSLMAVTPTTRSWKQFSAFIEEWDELRKAA